MRNICTVETCRDYVAGRGLCRKHYMRWRRWGNPEEPDHRSMRERKTCVVKYCDEQVHGDDLCSTHYRQKERDGDVSIGPIQKQCEWCNDHFVAQRKTARFCSRICAQRMRNQQPEEKRKALDRYYRKRYGLSVDEAEAMREGGCGICGRTEVTGRWENNLHIDHDHDTGEVRGVLCHGCNVSLGHFQHDPDLLQAAIAYLG